MLRIKTLSFLVFVILMIGICFLAQGLLAVALAVVFLARVGHLDAQLINAAQETLRCGHAVL